MRTGKLQILYCMVVLFLCSCTTTVSDYTKTNVPAQIDPDYSEIVLPPNIAPLNFKIQNTAEAFKVDIHSDKGEKIELVSRDGVVDIPISKWKKLLESNKGNKLIFSIYSQSENKWVKHPEIVNSIAAEDIDSHLVYRILYPGYELWNDMGIYQRNLETFEQKPIIENKALDNDCVNCHSFSQNSPETMMFHVRGKHGGTIILSEGEVSKRNIKVEEMPGGAVYPHWHPNGKFIAFSSNRIKQFFHSSGDKYIEVSDFKSDLIVYDVEDNVVVTDSVFKTKNHMETFPCWSPCGNYLYYTRATVPEDDNRKSIRYNLMRVAFSLSSNTFAEPETIFDAAEMGKSVSFPRISPDGKTLVFTLADYGNFTIWHNEADLYKIDLKTRVTEKLPVNSDWVESYHGWSSNGRWIVFSSKRRDTQCARPYFSYFDEDGKAHKPFVMPQKDPEFYDNFLRTYNIPELIKEPISVSQWDFINAAKNQALNAKAQK